MLTTNLGNLFPHSRPPNTSCFSSSVQCIHSPGHGKHSASSLTQERSVSKKTPNSHHKSLLRRSTPMKHALQRSSCPPAFIPSAAAGFNAADGTRTHTHTHTSSHRNLSDFYLCLSLMSTAMIANSNRHCAHPPRWTYIPVELGGPRSEVLDVLPKHSMYANKNMLTVSTGS